MDRFHTKSIPETDRAVNLLFQVLLMLRILHKGLISAIYEKVYMKHWAELSQKSFKKALTAINFGDILIFR